MKSLRSPGKCLLSLETQPSFQELAFLADSEWWQHGHANLGKLPSLFLKAAQADENLLAMISRVKGWGSDCFHFSQILTLVPSTIFKFGCRGHIPLGGMGRKKSHLELSKLHQECLSASQVKKKKKDISIYMIDQDPHSC